MAAPAVERRTFSRCSEEQLEDWDETQQETSLAVCAVLECLPSAHMCLSKLEEEELRLPCQQQQHLLYLCSGLDHAKEASAIDAARWSASVAEEEASEKAQHPLHLLQEHCCGRRSSGDPFRARRATRALGGVGWKRLNRQSNEPQSSSGGRLHQIRGKGFKAGQGNATQRSSTCRADGKRGGARSKIAGLSKSDTSTHTHTHTSTHIT
jgi:hypothetical protein